MTLIEQEQPSRPLSAAKQMVIRVISAVIMFLTGIYVGVDWSGYFHGFQSAFPAAAGYARTSPAWTSGCSGLPSFSRWSPIIF